MIFLVMLIRRYNLNVSTIRKLQPHHAIIPTCEAPSGLDADQQLLYDEIALRYILQWYPAMEFTETKYVFSVASEDFSGRSVFIRDKDLSLIGSNKEDEDTNDVSVAQKAVTAATGDPFLYLMLIIKKV